MADNSSHSPQPAWRGGDARQARHVRQRAWRKASEPSPSQPRRMSKRSKLIIAASSFAGVFIAFLVVLWLLRPVKPACLVLYGAPNDVNLSVPHNAHGWQSLKELAQQGNTSGVVGSFLWWTDAARLRLQHEPRRLQADTAWSKDLGSIREDTLIIFLAMHGGTDSQGAYFIKDDPRERHLLRLKEVLDHLGSAALKDKKKVLILDPTQVTAHWPSGMLHNGFVAALKEHEKEIEAIPNLVVLCSSDSHQRSWTSDEWRQSAFGHFVVEGLKGAAGQGGERITAWELFRYVRENVAGWASTNRDAVQVPILLGGESRAKSIDIALAGDAAKESSSEIKVPALPEKELKNAWEQYQKLREQAPSPSVYSPHVWRQYQDTLLRYEQLLRIGDPTEAAAALARTLEELERRIALARTLPQMTCLPYALPLPTALGTTGAVHEGGDYQELLEKFLAAPDARQLRQLWGAMKALTEKADRERGPSLVRLRVTSSVLKNLTSRAKLTRPDLDRADAILRVLHPPGTPWPVEAHQVAMLKLTLDVVTPPDLISNAVRLRLLAEEAALGTADSSQLPNVSGRVHPYSETVFACIQDRIKRADEERLRGEDLLLASRESSWNEARSHFKEAERLYRQAAKEGAVVRDGLHVRDEVLAWLPYYSQWLAGQHATKSTLQQTEQLWRDVHALANRLREQMGDPPERRANLREQAGDPPERATRLQELKALVQTVWDSYRDLKDKFDEQSRTPREERQISRLHAIEAALATPLITDVGLRMTMLRNSRNISSELLASQNKPTGLRTSDAQLAVDARRLAEQHGRLMTAMLGETWLGRTARDNILQALNPESLSPTRAGDQLGQSWGRMLETITKGLTASLTKKDLREAANDLRLPAELCRLVDGGTAARIPAEPFDPVIGSRRLWVHDLLVGQAERTLADHYWSAEPNNPDARPFYLDAGSAYAADAKPLAEAAPNADVNPDRVKSGVGKLQPRLKLGSLAAEPLPRLDVTSERQFEAAWTLKATGEVPRGIPMVWLETSRGLKLPSGERYAGRQELRDWLPPRVVYPLTSSALDEAYRQPPLVPKTASEQAVFRYFYRGQRGEVRTEVKLYLAADTVVYRYPETGKAGIAIRADEGVSQGALAIVLDASGSMTAKTGNKTRFRQATDALKEVLKEIPDGTRVSLWMYGQKEAGSKAVNHHGKGFQSNIEQILPPTLWRRDDPDQHHDLMKKVEFQTPWGHTPILDTMLMAKADLEGVTGFKTMLVLTDGEDNMFEGDIPLSLRKHFGNSDMFIAIICYQVDDTDKTRKDGKTEYERAEAVFGSIRKFAIPGVFEKADDSTRLVNLLKLAMRPKYQLQRQGNPVAGMPPEGFNVGMMRENLAWSLPLDPDFYKVIVHNAYAQNIRLGPGDRLLINLHRRRNDILFERALFAEERVNRSCRKQKAGDWLLGVLQNQDVRREQALRMLLSLENQTQRGVQRGGTLEQLRPGFTWFEIKAAGANRPGLRWGNETGYPAPTWRLNVGSWPLQSDKNNLPLAPELSAWWSRDPTPEIARTLEHDPRKTLDADFKGPVKVDTEDVVIESVGEENLLVTTAPDREDARQTRPCLVVRLRHNPGRRLWVQLLGMNHTGEEHHYYADAGKYTAIFYDVTNAAEQRFSLNLIPLETFKRRAEGQGNAVKLIDLPSPMPGDSGPTKERLPMRTH